MYVAPKINYLIYNLIFVKTKTIANISTRKQGNISFRDKVKL